MHRLTRFGIVPSSSELIERLARVRTVIFDKTGTLTEEEIRLDALIALDRIDSAALRARLALIESHSSHAVARPFSSLPTERSLPREQLLAIETMPGQGIAARLSSQAGNVAEFRIGNRSLLRPEHDAALEK